MAAIKVADIVILDEMPFDKVDSDGHFVHATGRELILSNGTVVFEYEDDIFEIGDIYEMDHSDCHPELDGTIEQ